MPVARAVIFRAALGLLALTAFSQANAGIINGDFETGDLSGWTLDIPGGSVTTLGVEPSPEGGNWAIMRLATDGTDIINATLSQSFTVTEKSRLHFDIDWKINAPGALGMTLGLAGSDIISGFGPFGPVTGNQSPAWVLLPGDYTIRLRTFPTPVGITPPDFEGWLAIDNVRLEVVPEPASLMLLMIGAVLTHWGIRRSRFASRR